MNSFKEYIIFSLLVIVIISLTIRVNDSSTFNQLIIETELEESISKIDVLSSFLEITNSGDDGNYGCAKTVSSTPLLPYFDFTSSTFLTSNEAAKKHPLFILYCCLKIDC